MKTRTAARIGLLLVLAVAAPACAASPSKSAARAPESAAPGHGEAQAASPSAPAPAEPSQYAAPPPASPSAPGTTQDQPQGGATSRSMALQSASREIDSSQRELDVAAGDCRNACRALGSMDRAAGKVCELAQGEASGHRCDDAKKRVYSARDRVRTTCGGCPGGPSVERTAPIPSLH